MRVNQNFNDFSQYSVTSKAFTFLKFLKLWTSKAGCWRIHLWNWKRGTDIDTASWKFQGRWAARLSLALNTDHKPCFFLLTGDSWAVCRSHKPRPIAAGLTAGRTAKESRYHQINGRAPRRNFQTVGRGPVICHRKSLIAFSAAGRLSVKNIGRNTWPSFSPILSALQISALRSNPNFSQHWSTITFPKWPILPSNTAGP